MIGVCPMIYLHSALAYICKFQLALLSEAIRFLLLIALVGSSLNLFDSLVGLISGACVVRRPRELPESHRRVEGLEAELQADTRIDKQFDHVRPFCAPRFCLAWP